VLVLLEGSPNLPVNSIFTGIFRQAFGADDRNQFFEEYFDERRLTVDNENLAQALSRKYGEKKVALIIGVGEPTLNFLLERGPQLWPGIPEIFDMVDSRRLPASLPANMTGITTDVDLGPTMDLALQLMPFTRRAFFIGGASPDEKVWRSLAEQSLKRFSGRIEFTYLDDLPLPEMLDRLGRLPDDSIVLYGMLYKDVRDQAFVPARVCTQIVSSSKAPVFGPFETYVGCGIVGGSMVDFSDTALRTASLGLRVLERGTVSGLPLEQSPAGHTVVDSRQLERWGIGEKRLPEGTVVRFRTPSAWERYKRFALPGLAVTAVLLATTVILVREKRRRRNSELAVKSLSGRLISAGEEERKRIARELHDDISQRLSIVSLELATQRSSHEPLQHLKEIITDVHNLSHQLHPGKVELLGLKVALRDLCRQLSKQHAIVIDLVDDDFRTSLPPEVALCFYRVAQEALHNSVKHSGSAQIQVRLTAADGVVQMSIKDNGSGFDSNSAANGLGLATMKERVRLVDGTLAINSKPGAGTEVTVQAPAGETSPPNRVKSAS
jgi:signal transduction histidine kinase